MSSKKLQDISVVDVFPSSDNAREFNPKDQDFKDLVTSVRAGGVNIPIHVWAHPKKKGKYEIRAGERRWQACKVVGLKTIPAIIHTGITRQVALLLTYTENKFRKPLKPLEEIQEIATCMKELDSDAKLIADLLGQPEHWVRLRANIHKNLCPEFQKAFEKRQEYRFFKNWTVGHLTLIARLPITSQKELFTTMKTFHWQWENVSVKDLEKRLSDVLQLLVKAPWKLGDVTLYPRAGACTECPKRSGAAPLLWFGKAGDQDAEKDRCLDNQCWKEKQRSYLQRRAMELSKKHDNLAFVAAGYLSSEEKEGLSKKFGRVYDQNDVKKSTKGSRNTIPALVVQGKGAGQVVYVKEVKFARASGPKIVPRLTSMKERRAKLQAKRYAQVLVVLQEKVEGIEVSGLVFKDKLTGVMALAAFFGNSSMRPGVSEKATQKEIDVLVSKARGRGQEAARSEAVASLWASVKPTLGQMLNYFGPVTQTPRGVLQKAGWIADLCKIDTHKILEEISIQKGFTEPASWKGLNEDGSPKKKKEQKSKTKKTKEVKTNVKTRKSN